MKILTIMILLFFSFSGCLASIFLLLNPLILSHLKQRRSQMSIISGREKAKYKFIKIKNIQKLFEEKSGNKNKSQISS